MSLKKNYTTKERFAILEKVTTELYVAMHKLDDIKLLSNLYDRKYLSEDETLVLAEGFDDAIVGISTQFPKRIVYNYWECINILLKIGDEQTQLDFDDSMIYLDEYIKEISSIKDFAPIFIKMI
jgi:hypothetical protein